MAVIAGAFNEAADFLQLPYGLSVLLGIAALIVAVRSPLARNLVVASLVLTLAPFPAILLFGDTLAEAGVGGGLRLALGAVASLLAMAATVAIRGRTQSA